MNASPIQACSTFALDVYWTSGEQGAPELAQHLEGCAACRAYLAMLGDLDAREEVVTAIRPRARAPRRFGVVAQVTAALAFAAGICVLVQSAPKTAPTPVYVGVKGTPSVQLLIHHGGETAIWDGRTRVRAGDAIALRASCADLANVVVAAESPARGRWWRLSETACPASGDVLPFTLVVDGQSEEEHLAVVMSDARLSDDDLARAADDSERSPHVWAVRFVIPERRQ